MSTTRRDWCILRCSNCKTLELARSLADAGFEAWAPTDEDGEPMTASYVFARLRHLPELLALARSPSPNYQVWDAEKQKMVTRGHPYFRLMPDPFTTWAMARDAHLAPLRQIERRRKPRGVVKTIPVGARVRLSEGGFAGLDGEVQSVRNKFATVAFVGFPVPVQIGCWLLTEMVDDPAKVHVKEDSTERPAKAA